ncbi:MAG: APC family permease [Vulcanisaeta sp.]
MEGEDISRFGYRQELRREITWVDVLIYSLVTMVPIAPWGIYGIVASVIGGMPSLAYLLGMLGMMPTPYAYFLMVKEFPLAGSVYNYAQRAVNPTYGFIAGISIMLDYFLVPGLVYVVAALAMNSLVPQIPYWAWVLIFLIPMTTVSVIGIRITAMANRLLLIIELAALLIFVGYAIGYAVIHKINPTFTPFYNPQTFKLDTLLNATSIAVLSYLGFDAATTLAEEHRGRAMYIGRAVVLSVFLIGLMFISQTYLAYLTYPTYNFQNPDTGFYEVATTVGGSILLAIVTISTAIAWGIGDGLAVTTAIARVIYAMGRDRFLPRAVARVHPRFGTPWIATIVGGSISTIIAVTVPLDLLVSLVNFGALTAFILLHVAVLYYFGYKKGELRPVLVSIAGLAILIPVWYGLSFDAKMLGISWLIFWIIYTMIITKGFKGRIAIPGI